MQRRGREAFLEEERTEGEGDGAGKGLGPPRVMGRRVSTWAKGWAGLLGSSPNWIGLPGIFFLFYLVLHPC